jgi:hypothetical protein
MDRKIVAKLQLEAFFQCSPACLYIIENRRQVNKIIHDFEDDEDGDRDFQYLIFLMRSMLITTSRPRTRRRNSSDLDDDPDDFDAVAERAANDFPNAFGKAKRHKSTNIVLKTLQSVTFKNALKRHASSCSHVRNLKKAIHAILHSND